MWRMPVPRGATGWGAGAAVGVVFLLVQVFAWRFDRWTLEPNLRPVYAGACAVLRCELPVLRSVQDIAVGGLSLRAHPNAAGALVVAALLRNEASFAQPFPALELRLSNLAGEVVAARRFRPEEYLAAGHARGAAMPVMTSVRVAVEIRSPPVEAVNAALVPR